MGGGGMGGGGKGAWERPCSEIMVRTALDGRKEWSIIELQVVAALRCTQDAHAVTVYVPPRGAGGRGSARGRGGIGLAVCVAEGAGVPVAASDPPAPPAQGEFETRDPALKTLNGLEIGNLVCKGACPARAPAAQERSAGN